MLGKCCNHSKQCRNNVEMMCCVKNRRCKSSCVTWPVTSKVVLTFESMRLWAKFYGITIHMKPLSKNFQMVLFVFRHFTQSKFRTSVKFDFDYRYTLLFINTQILKFKSQLTFAFFAAINHFSEPLRNKSLLHRVQFKASLEQFYIFNYAAEGQQEQVMVCDLCDWWISIHYVCFCVKGSLLVIVIMIDGSEKRNCEGGFWTSEFACFWKAQQARKRFKKTLETLPGRTCLHLTSHWISEASDLI